MEIIVSVKIPLIFQEKMSLQDYKSCDFFHALVLVFRTCPPGSGYFSGMFMLLRWVFLVWTWIFMIFLIFTEIRTTKFITGQQIPSKSIADEISKIKKSWKFLRHREKTRRSNINIAEKLPEPGGHITKLENSMWKKSQLLKYFSLEPLKIIGFHWISIDFHCSFGNTYVPVIPVYAHECIELHHARVIIIQIIFNSFLNSIDFCKYQ